MFSTMDFESLTTGFLDMRIITRQLSLKVRLSSAVFRKVLIEKQIGLTGFLFR